MEELLTWEQFMELCKKEKRTKDEWESFLERKRLAHDYLELQLKYFSMCNSHEDEIKLLQQKIEEGWKSRQALAFSLTNANNEIKSLKEKIRDLTLEKMVLESRLDKRTIWQILRLKPVKQ